MNTITESTAAVKTLGAVELVTYEVLKSGASGLVGTLSRFFTKHPELENDPEWVARDEASMKLWREVQESFKMFAEADDPIAAMQPYFDRVHALRIPGETY